ncbi:MAG: hypothetical protein JO121_06100 [Deltaproteobacteria bacterium]|nr:hypothetical protein [Deltaproteobacteria bacterium]
MQSVVLCLGAFLVVYSCTRRSLTAGLNAVLTVGYAYGIVRANIPQTFSHFIFDAGIGGLYLGMAWNGLSPIQRLRIQRIRPWVIALIGWPVLLMFVPAQDAVIQLVGLRGVVWFLPFLFVGALADDDGGSKLALWLAVLNLVALAFALSEVSWGLPRFYPYNDVTYLIYQQNDVVPGDYTIFRIPAIFVNQACYSGTMVLSLPLLVGTWVQRECTRRERVLLTAGVIAAMLGVFLGASRTHALLFFAQLLTFATFVRLRASNLLALAAVGVLVGYWVFTQPRLQRFTQLDAGFIEERVRASANASFLDALVDYPLGNGLGGGTSMPYFLQDRVRNPVGMENEYGRILLETGIPGLLLWVAFLLSALISSPSERTGRWRIGRRLARASVALFFGTAFIGAGLLTAIPAACILLYMTGWLYVPKLRPLRVTADDALQWAHRIPG